MVARVGVARRDCARRSARGVGIARYRCPRWCRRWCWGCACRRRCSATAYCPVNAVNLVRTARSRYADRQLWHPSRADSEAAAWVLPGCGVVGLYSAIGPTPFALRGEVHVGLDLDPVRALAEDRRDGQGYREGRAHYRDRLVQRAENLGAGKTRAVGVNEDIPIKGRSRAIEVHPIGVN